MESKPRDGHPWASPDQNILAGARYLAYMKERIPPRIHDPDRTWMAMAAYNVGIGHLEDARIITQMRKKNPDRWPDVRASLLRLADPYWHSRVKRGYANGHETVQFVERVSQFAAILESSVPDPKVGNAGSIGCLVIIAVLIIATLFCISGRRSETSFESFDSEPLGTAANSRRSTPTDVQNNPCFRACATRMSAVHGLSA